MVEIKGDKLQVRRLRTANRSYALPEKGPRKQRPRPPVLERLAELERYERGKLAPVHRGSVKNRRIKAPLGDFNG